MIDREARDHIASTLRSYMDEKITAFDLDEAIENVLDDTEDETLKRLCFDLWCCYDDITDHKIVATKELWKSFHRALLLLESQTEHSVQKGPWQWHPHQAIAAICLIAFSTIVWKFGLGEHLLIFAMPFGLVSMWLAWRYNRLETSQQKTAPETAPFPSISSLRVARHQVPNFQKRPYPQHVNERQIRNPILGFLGLLPFRTMWLMLAPLPLFFQMLPKRENQTVTKLPEQTA